MTILRERIETTLPLDEPSPSSPTSPTPQRWDPGVATLRAHEPGSGRRRARATDLGVRMGGRVVADGLRGHGLRALTGASCSRARAAASGPSTRSGSPRPPTGTRIDYTADIRLVGLLRLVAPVRRRGAGAASARDARDGHAARARRAGDGGLTAMDVAIVGSGISGLAAAYALRARPPGHRVRARRRAGGHVATVDGRRARRTGRGRHRVHRLQRADVPAVRRAARRARRRDPAQRHVVRLCRVDACGVAFSSRGAARASSPTRGTVARPAPVADARRRRAASTAMRARSSTVPTPATATLGDWLDERRLRTPVPRPLPRPDHVGRLVDRGRPDR